MSRDHLASLLSDRYGNLRITAPSPTIDENSLSVDRNPRLFVFISETQQKKIKTLKLHIFSFEKINFIVLYLIFIFYRRTRSLNAPSPVQQFGPCGRIMKNSAMVMQIQVNYLFNASIIGGLKFRFHLGSRKPTLDMVQTSTGCFGD